jgi:hypothetical protein
MKRTLALLAAAEAGDLLTTWYGLTHGAHEANPATLAAVAFGGWAVVAVVKLGTVPVVALATQCLPESWRAHWLKGIRIGALMLMGVVAANVLVTL